MEVNAFLISLLEMLAVMALFSEPRKLILSFLLILLFLSPENSTRALSPDGSAVADCYQRGDGRREVETCLLVSQRMLFRNELVQGGCRLPSLTLSSAFMKC